VAAPPEFVREWVESIRGAAPDRASGRERVQMYILDNEPALWSSTHRDVHPEPVTYDELLDRTLRYGAAVRSAAPRALIAGPAEWGWTGYFYSARDSSIGVRLRPDRRLHGDVPLVPWLLQRVRAHERETGTRILDVLDLHHYPQAGGIGIGTGGGTDPATAALRIRSTRALWDPTYVDESWIKEPVRLIPRMQEWIRDFAPGLGTSIGEWNFGAEQHMSGGLAVAEALGRFGSLGLTSAFYWIVPPRDSPAANGFRAYRDFDGQGGHFLEQSVAASSEQPGRSSVFASRSADGRHVVAVLLDLDAEAPMLAEVDLRSCGVVESARAFAYDGTTPRLVPTSVVAGREPFVRLPLKPWSIGVLDLVVAPGSVR
jgi:hypothetical protein